MASISAVTFNSGSTIDGTIQVGQLAIGSTPQDYTNEPGGLRWWSSADLDSGYIIAHVNANANQPNSQGISGVKVGFWRTQFTDSDFISWAEYIAKRYHTPETFSTATEANIWLFANGYWTSYSNEPIPTTTLTPTLTTTPTPTPTPSSTPSDDALFDPIITENDEYIDLGNDEYLMFVDPSGPVVTPSSTPEVTTTPTPSVTETPTNTPTPSLSVTATPSVTPTITPTSSEISATPTQTPTPSSTPIPVTGYGYNLIALPYNFPTSGSSIMNAISPEQTGTTLINELSITQRGFYFNSIDNTGVDRTSYYSQFTGQSVTITFTQNGDSAIYSGDSTSFKFWSGNTGTPPGESGTGFVFGTDIGVPPIGTPSGTAILIQSASTTWVTGVTVYVSVQNSEPEVTPTPTATSVTPTPSPTSGAITSGFTVTIQQIGPDVVWSGSGSFDISNLSLEGTQQLSAGFSANSAVWAVGPNIQVNVESYSGVAFDTYPTSFGTGGSPATNGTGDLFGILPGGSGRSLVVPENYISGTQLSGSTTYANTTISGLNLVVGTYTYSWGTNPGETLTLIIG